MKIKKNRAIVISLMVGTVLFASTAFAEINSKSGYDQLKDALKFTAESCTSKLSSYTMEQSLVIKDNGNVIYQKNGVDKSDLTKGTHESKTTSIDEGKTTESYIYADDNESIYYNKDQDTYYVNKFENKNYVNDVKNPFKEKQASDVEKIADAIVGNLKDSIVVNEKDNGVKELSGSVSEAQIPAIANALVSYGFKSRFGNNYITRRIEGQGTMPKIVDDIYVKEIKGDMTLDKTDLINTVMGTGVLLGKDENAKEHSITFEVLIKIKDVNNTTVNKPDVAGKKVQTSIQKDYSKISKPEMYLGTYENDIVIEKDNRFVKIGERIVEIKGLDDKNVTGRYHEQFVKGYEEYSSKARDFEFSSKFENGLNGTFDVTDASGEKISGSLWIDISSPRIGFNINEDAKSGLLYTGEYNRVFN